MKEVQLNIKIGKSKKDMANIIAVSRGITLKELIEEYIEIGIGNELKKNNINKISERIFQGIEI